MANTPNLNLIELIYDNTKKVKDFFMNEIIGKINSNNTKIDTAITEKVTQVALKSSLPTSPTSTNNLYIVYGDTTADNNGQYRWTGTTYEKVSTQLDYATQTEAEGGTDNTKVMTPLRTSQLVDIKVGDLSAENITIADVNNKFTSLTVEGALGELDTELDNKADLINGKVSNEQLPIVNDLTTGGATKIASAETVKSLNNNKANKSELAYFDCSFVDNSQYFSLYECIADFRSMGFINGKFYAKGLDDLPYPNIYYYVEYLTNVIDFTVLVRLTESNNRIKNYMRLLDIDNSNWKTDWEDIITNTDFVHMNEIKAPSHQSGTAAPTSFVGEGVLYGVHS